MEPTKLFLEDGTPIKQQFCGKCMRIWAEEASAKRCCLCSYCGEHFLWKGANVCHPECQRKVYDKADASALERAVLIPDYHGPFLFDDRVYMDTAEFFDSVAPDELPEFEFCTRYQAPYLDAQDVMADAGEMHDDWEPLGEAELSGALDVWNEANKTNGTHWEDRTRKWSKALMLKRLKGAE